MPKKITGLNHKALAASAKKLAAKEAKLADELKELEDQMWIDNNKKAKKKEQRKEKQETKRQETVDRKVKNKVLLEEEIMTIDLKRAPPPKLTRNQLLMNTLEKPKGTINKKRSDFLTENINSPINDEEARSIDAAIALLSLEEKAPDRHPEKRMKAGYKAFEERRVQEITIKNPTLRLSQVKQVLFKDWEKSNENPRNKM